MTQYNGPERRHDQVVTYGDIQKLTESVESLQAKLETHMALEESYKPKVIELIDVLQKSKGAIGLIKILFAIGTPLGAFAIWAKDHIKW